MNTFNLKSIPALHDIYVWLSAFISGILAYYTDLHYALYFFLGTTVLDTISAIDAQARSKGLKFDPTKKYFWLQIKSSGIRDWMRKVFWEYGRYCLIAIMLNEWVLKNMIVLEAFDRKLTLPVVAVYLFGFIELWSIGENMEKAGGVNLFKRVLHFLPDNIQKIVKNDDGSVIKINNEEQKQEP
jgi:hypothetical protein